MEGQGEVREVQERRTTHGVLERVEGQTHLVLPLDLLVELHCLQRCSELGVVADVRRDVPRNTIMLSLVGG